MNFISDAFLPQPRERNAVDELLTQIRVAQSACTHSFKLWRIPNIIPSKIDGVWILNTEADRYGILHVSCTKCSRFETRAVKDTCPNCLGELTSGITEDRGVYFQDSIRHRETALMLSCGYCEFRGVFDESFFDTIRE